MRYTSGQLNSKTGLKSWGVMILMLMTAFLLMHPVHAYADEFADEAKLGKDAAVQVAKDSKFIDDPALVARVNTIGQAIAKVACENEVAATFGKSTVAKFNYTFKIVNDKEINAFSLPGGYVYVNKGLIDYIQSDDELAGVIAHEVAHAAHHHAIQLVKAQQKQMLGVGAAIILGTLIGANGNDLGSLAYAANLVSMAKLSAYGQKAEFDADRTAVDYLSDAGYNASGMLTFMERLASDEIRKPEVTYGIYATHPPSNLRAREIIGEIDKLGLTINRRLVTTYMRVQAKPVDATKAYSVNIGNIQIACIADSSKEKASTRAERVAGKLNDLLIAGATFHDIRTSTDGTSVIVMGETLFTPSTEDAALANASVPQVVNSTAKSIRQALLTELIQGKY